jgi:cytidyltransferase-like protein
MSIVVEELVRRVHDSHWQVVLALNGGSRALADLLDVPGGSRTLLEAIVPYSEDALISLLGSRPEQFCSARTARATAVAAFGRAMRYGATEESAAGIASSASLASDRPKRGSHRAHIALQTAARTACWSLELTKGARSRAEEEQLVGRMVLNAVADASGIAERLELPLLDEERVDVQQITALQEWQDLFLGRIDVIRARSNGISPNAFAPKVIFPGAFNPPHVGHRRMAEIAAEMLGWPVEFEISIVNVDKPPLDYVEIEQRLAPYAPEQSVWLTRAATFDEKSRLFPGATFVVGADTLRRIVDPRYYGNDRALMIQAIDRIAARGCKFMVFGRQTDAGFIRQCDLDLPDALRNLCSEIPRERFQEDVSSSALRSKDDD